MDNRFLQFTVRLARLNKRVQALKTDAMGRLGLKAAHTAVLCALAQNQTGLHFSELCTQCDLDGALVSRTLAALRKRGLVEKLGEPGHYNALYTLTEPGAVQTGQMLNAIERGTAAAVQGIEEADLTAFYRVLDRFQQNLDAIQQETDRLFAAENPAEIPVQPANPEPPANKT